MNCVLIFFFFNKKLLDNIIENIINNINNNFTIDNIYDLIICNQNILIFLLFI